MEGRKAEMDENTQVQFDEKLKELITLAKKKKNELDLKEVQDFVAAMKLQEEQMDKVFEELEKNGVEILGIPEADDIADDEIILTEADEVDVENLDLTLPDGYNLTTEFEQCLPFSDIFYVRQLLQLQFCFRCTQKSLSRNNPQKTAMQITFLPLLSIAAK